MNTLAAWGGRFRSAAIGRGTGRGERNTLTPSPGGEIVMVAGHPTHIRRGVSADGPWAVLESALGCPCTEWVWVQERLAECGINSIAWDRPGIGATPTAGRTADTADGHVNRLTALMNQEGIANAVFVGHSVGALLVRAFAVVHPERARALVLVEGTHPRQRERSPRQADLMTAMERRLISGRPTSFEHVREATTSLPATLRDWTARAASGRASDLATLRELQRVGLWSRAVDASGMGGEIPVCVLTAGRAVEADPAHLTLQEELAALGAGSSEPTVVPGAGHQDIVMAQEFAAVVASAVERAVYAAGSGTMDGRRAGQTR